MNNLRFWLGDALICLPLATLIAGGWLFWRTAVPGIERREAERVDGAYRELAIAVKEGELASESLALDSRKARGRLGKGSWGREPSANGQLVWYRPPRSHRILGATVPTIPEVRYRRQFAGIGLLVLALVTILTDLGLRFFRRCTRERDDFLAAAAHDLATPLVGMRRLIGRDDAQALQLNERMIRLVENIRDYLRLGGRRQPHCSEFPIGTAFDEAYRLWAADFAEAESGPVTVSGDSALRVRADETMIVQVFWNLLGNVFKYAAASGPISARFEARNKELVFSLADRGPGMSANQRRHAFDRYYRARTALQSGKGGFGIGLCTARELVRKCHGDLKVMENQPTGCVFCLTLPLI